MHRESSDVVFDWAIPQPVAEKPAKTLPAIYRKAARLVASEGIAAETAIWELHGAPLDHCPAELLWGSFVCEGGLHWGDEAVLGLLLLAEILEAAG